VPRREIGRRTVRGLDRLWDHDLDVLLRRVPAAGKIRWQRRAPGHLMDGAAVVADGGVLFYGAIQAYLNGLDGQDRIVTSRKGMAVYGSDGGR
jgi:hypothetical protein